MTLNDHHTSHPILYPISFDTSIPSPTLRDNLWLRNNAYFELLWIIRQVINIGLVSEIFERLYEKYKV